MGHMSLDDDLKRMLAKAPMPPAEVYELLRVEMFSICSTSNLDDATEAIRTYTKHLRTQDARALRKAIPAAAAKSKTGFLPPLGKVIEEVEIAWNEIQRRLRRRAENIQHERWNAEKARNASQRLANVVSATTRSIGGG